MALAISLWIIPSKLLPIWDEVFIMDLFHSLLPPVYFPLLVGLSVARLLVLLLFRLLCKDLGKRDLEAERERFFLAVFTDLIASGRGGNGGGGMFCMPRMSAHFVLF